MKSIVFGGMPGLSILSGGMPGLTQSALTETADQTRVTRPSRPVPIEK